MEQRNERLCGNTATGTLKLIAFVFMAIDHAGAAFFNGKAGFLPYVAEMRVLGRLAFPIYAWCIAVGVCRTRNVYRYLLRMLIMTVISQPVYALAMGHAWYQISIFGTLSLGLAAVIGIRENRFFSRLWAPVLCVGAAFLIQVDYGWQGVLFIIFLYLCRKEKGSLIAVMIAYCLFWGYTSGSSLTKLCGIALPRTIAFLPRADKFLASIFRMQFCAVFSLPFLLIPMKNVKISKKITYALYPAHLLVILVIRYAFGLM